MCKCDTCEHMVFDEVWGEIKCKAKCQVIYKPEAQSDCKKYKKTFVKQTSRKEQASL